MKKPRGSSARGARTGKSANATKQKRIDFSDIPELSEKQLSSMRRVGRPTLGDEPRRLIAIRLDSNVLGWLRRTAERKGLPYQSLINEILAEEMKKAG
ncbi:MAG: BrnA antitoxin family protein [Candidatus Binatia bacterium]